MKTIVYFVVLSAAIVGYFHQRHQVGILNAEIERLETKCREFEARDVIRADTLPQRWGQEYLDERVHR